jgi:hypothetical protein
MLCTKTALHFSRRITDRVTTLISGGTLVGSPDTLTIHDSTWLLIAVLPCSLTKNKVAQSSLAGLAKASRQSPSCPSFTQRLNGSR